MSRHDASAAAAHRHRNGLIYGLGAYGLWGVMPIYFKQLDGISPVDIVAHRVFWSVPFLAFLLTAAKAWPSLRAIVADRRTLGLLSLSAVLIATNWLLYVYSVTSGQILASSLGYFLNPLGNVLLGRFVLGERLSRLQWTAVAIAAAGIAVLAAGASGGLWLSLTLCVSFALYGLIRKVVAAEALTGLAVETTLLAPLAIGWLALGWAGGGQVFGSDAVDRSLLVFAGIATTTPLLLFAAAARRIAYSTLGMLQFLAPTLQFLLGVFAYGEHFTLAHAIAFGSIWVALALYVAAMARQPKLPPPPE